MASQLNVDASIDASSESAVQIHVQIVASPPAQGLPEGTSLLDLDPEVVSLILSGLNARSQAAVMSTCKLVALILGERLCIANLGVTADDAAVFLREAWHLPLITLLSSRMAPILWPR